MNRVAKRASSIAVYSTTLDFLDFHSIKVNLLKSVQASSFSRVVLKHIQTRINCERGCGHSLVSSGLNCKGLVFPCNLQRNGDESTAKHLHRAAYLAT